MVVKGEGMEREEAAVEVVAVKGGAGNDLSQILLSQSPNGTISNIGHIAFFRNAVSPDGLAAECHRICE